MRELFEKEAPRQLRRTRHQLYQHINADYYGFRDEEDGLLVRVEAAAEQLLRQQARTSPYPRLCAVSGAALAHISSACKRAVPPGVLLLYRPPLVTVAMLLASSG